MRKRENFSQKRTAILAALCDTTTHPTADWIYAQLKPEYPNLSLGTVYRNLKRFCESGQAISVGVINGQEHFDGTVKPHAHFVCDNCGSVLDVDGKFFAPRELSRLSTKTGWKFTGAAVTFHGLCDACLNPACTTGKAEDNKLTVTDTIN